MHNKKCIFSKNYVEVVRMLLAAGANPRMRDDDGETAMDKAREEYPIGNENYPMQKSQEAVPAAREAHP